MLKKIRRLLKIYKFREQRVKKRFKKIHSYELNLKNPKTFSEKIQYRKLRERNILYTLCADKHKVREYVEEKIGGDYLIPLYGVFDRVTEEDINKLPKSFVIKANHGSGWLDIVFDKTKIDIFELILKCNGWMGMNSYYKTGEVHYRDIPPKIIVEELITENGRIPKDYKLHCFNNKKGFECVIAVVTDRDEDQKISYYDVHWNLLDLKYRYKNAELIEKPENLDEIIKLSKKLSEDFNYVRVDLYSVNNKIYFGELTFTPSNGYGKINPYEWDLKLGEKWEL